MAANNRIIIVSGGSIGKRALEILRDRQEDDLLVGADYGALFLVDNGMKPDVALGDFDSVSDEEKIRIAAASGHIEAFDAIDKDWTDTELAFHWALEQNPRRIVLLGVTGTRLDHTLSNLFMLERALKSGIECIVVDDHNEIQVIDRSCTISRSTYTYLSLISLSSVTTGITLEGFQYPLSGATLRRAQSLGISNVLVGDTGSITLDTGLLLVIQSRD